MFNDFFLVGPPDDPAGMRNLKDPGAALKILAGKAIPFVSRGDDSGTHKKEKFLWREAGIAPAGPWYMETGQGMGATLIVANEKRAYCLTDRGTYIALRGKIDLSVHLEGDPRLHNPYGIIAVHPARHPQVKYMEAMMLIAWITSPAGQKIIGDFRRDGDVL
ncbi:MAG: ABC transporter substrate-binding protein, partial [Planctomycetota bacterium]